MYFSLIFRFTVVGGKRKKGRFPHNIAQPPKTYPPKFAAVLSYFKFVKKILHGRKRNKSCEKVRFFFKKHGFLSSQRNLPRISLCCKHMLQQTSRPPRGDDYWIFLTPKTFPIPRKTFMGTSKVSKKFYMAGNEQKVVKKCDFSSKNKNFLLSEKSTWYKSL